MFRKLSILWLLLAGILPGRAALFSSGTLNATIPDNDPNGYVSTINVSGFSGPVRTVDVLLNVSGGYNGDLFAYVTYNGTSVILLNRVGTSSGNTYGYGDTGFNIRLSDSGLSGLHYYQDNGGQINGSGQLTGTWQPDSAGVSFTSAYQNSSGNGSWSIFFADLDAGDQSTLVSWSLDVTPVAEPINTALAIFGTLFAAAFVVHRTKSWFLRNRRSGMSYAETAGGEDSLPLPEQLG
jgi:subtilisin-like proprotein convertase family protein